MLVTMRRFLFLLSLATACGKKTDEPPPAPKTVDPAKPDPSSTVRADKPDLERGKYLADLTGCATCHTAVGPRGPDMEHAFAGGFEVPEKFGTWRSPNITPDPKTGIGKWSDAEIARAIREGVRPDGRQLYPIMPYLLYNRMTDADVNALVAFLRSLPPVERVIEPNKLQLPQIPAPKAANLPDPSDDPVKHGAYLTSLMICSHCHATPDEHGAPTPGKEFAGGLEFRIPFLGTGSLYAPNLTADADTGIGKWTPEQIGQVIKTMTRPDGRMIRGPMLFLQTGWYRITDGDLAAVSAYIHQLPAVANKVPESTFKPNPPGPPGPPADGAGSGAKK